MKSYILLVTLLIIIFCHWSAASTTGINPRQTSAITELVGGRLRNLWTWIWSKKGTENNFVDRCFGVARRLKFAMPVILFKLGVIVTILVFLTIFSLKSLGLLVMLVMFNSTGLAAKLALTKGGGHKQWERPQNVHFHVHSKDFVKDGHFQSDYEHGWDDRNGVEDGEYDSLDDRLKRLNIYEGYYKKY